MRHRRSGLRNRAWRVFRKAWLVIGLSSLVVVVDPFGYRTALDHQGARLFAWYAGLLHGEGARAHTLVVLLQESDLDHLHEPWPMRYETHARILREIRTQVDPRTSEQRKPLALMIDFLFIDKHRDDGSLTELVKELENYKSDQIPVFLALPLVRDPESAVLGELRGSVTADPSQPHLLREDRLTRLVPVPRFVEEEQHNLYRFFLCTVTDSRHPERCHWNRTAAVALYDQICSRDPRTCGGRRLPIDEKLHEKELALIWGRKPPDCWTVEATGCAVERSDCPLTPTVSVTRLMNSEHSLSPLVSDKVVFYGANLEGTADLVRPPLRQPLAGVYAHAMAFDNLLTYGTNYKREPPLPALAFWRVRISVPPVALASVTVVQFILLCFGSSLREHLQKRRPHWRAILASSALYVGTGLAWVAIVTAVEFHWYNYLSGDWLEIFLELVVGTHAAEILSEFVETRHPTDA